MQSVPGHNDPNNDINHDDNGRSGAGVYPGLDVLDIASGIITLTADGEPLNDGDRIDDWYDYDPSGNQTVDFGFFGDSSTTPIAKEAYANQISIYPNPTQEVLMVKIEQVEVSSLEIWSIRGQKMLTARPDNTKQFHRCYCP